MTRPVNLLRRALPFLSVALVAAIAYDGWIFYGRSKSVRDAERARQQEETRRARETIDLLGGTSFRIINFYAAPQTVRRGQSTRLCFGVYAAKLVRIEPGLGNVHPAINQCLAVTPHRDTLYKLTAEDAAGNALTQSVQVKVIP